MRSVRRFCLKNEIHAQNRLSNDEVEQCTKEVVARVGIHELFVLFVKDLQFYLLLKKSKVSYFLEDVNTHQAD